MKLSVPRLCLPACSLARGLTKPETYSASKRIYGYQGRCYYYECRIFFVQIIFRMIMATRRKKKKKRKMNDRSRRKEKLIDGSISWKIGATPLRLSAEYPCSVSKVSLDKDIFEFRRRLARRVGDIYSTLSRNRISW